MLQAILVAVLLAAAATAIGLAARAASRRILSHARGRAATIAQEAESQAQVHLKEIELEIEERRTAAEAQFEAQTRKRRQDLQATEERLREQERNLMRRLQLLGQKQQEQDGRETRLNERELTLSGQEKEAQALLQERRQRLERTAGLTAGQARRELVRDIEAEARQEAAPMIRRAEEEAREQAAARARRLVAEAIQRLPTGTIVDNVVTVVKLPSDDMKGRIIGREGRNIRAIEMATGVDLIVDETPQVIVLSGYDPFRRAVACAAILRLIEDGRIHPARIEEVVEKTRAEMEQGLESQGEAAAFELGITGLPSRLTRLLGRLKYRVVEGYNLLDHSLAVARLAQQMAVMIGAQAEVSRRAGLLHEIGQVEEGEATATHPLLVSADLAVKFGEDPRVVQAIRALHSDAPETSVEAILLKVAERAAIARPGEMDPNLVIFIERMRHLEDIASSFSGVSKAFAMRSGKEIRVIVESKAASDNDVIWISKDITARIQQEVQFSGTIRVSVIRETRAVDFAT
jgi:ribonuclease Y